MKALTKPPYERATREKPVVQKRGRNIRKLGHDLVSNTVVVPLSQKKRRMTSLTTSTTDSDSSSEERNALHWNSSMDERKSLHWSFCGYLNDLKICAGADALLCEADSSLAAAAPLSPPSDSCLTLSPHFQSELDRCELELKDARVKHGPNHPEIATILNRIGLLYQHMVRNHVKALAYHGEAIRILDKENSSDEIPSSLVEEKAFVLGDMAQIHELRCDRSAALSKYWEALQLFQSVKASGNKARVLSTKQAIKRLCRCASETQEECTCYATYEIKTL